MDWLTTYASALWSLLLDTGLWLIAGLAFAGLMHALIPAGFLERHLGGRGIAPIAKASLLGVPLPLCSCSVIPVAAGLHRSGAGKGASAAFAISTPQTGEESIPLTWALFGPVFAIARPIVAVITAFIAGLLIDRFANQPATQPDTQPAADTPLTQAPSCCCAPKPEPAAKPCCASTKPANNKPPLASRLKHGMRFAFGTMLVDLAPWLALGLALAALIAAAVPEQWIAEHVGTGVGPMLLMLVVGLPLYVCATSSTPLAATLVAAGLSPGAALVLLLAGPATNIATMAWLFKDLGVRALVIYLATIAVVSVACGLAVDAFLLPFISVTVGEHTHDHGPGALHTTMAVLLATAILAGLAVRTARLLRRSHASARDTRPQQITV